MPSVSSSSVRSTPARRTRTPGSRSSQEWSPEPSSPMRTIRRPLARFRSRIVPPATSRPRSTIATDSHIASAELHLVGREDQRPALVAQLEERLAQEDEVDRIEARERLVHEQDLGLVEDRGDELDLLLVALRQLLGAPVRRIRGCGSGPASACASLRARSRRRAVQRGEVDELVEDRHPRIQPALLGEVAPRPAGQLGAGRAVPADLAGVRLEDAETDPHRGRLAGAVGAEEAEDRPARNLNSSPSSAVRARSAW